MVVGGDVSRPCNAAAFCTEPHQLLSDGAAYDPKRKTWRPIKSAPVPIRAAVNEPVVAGNTVYYLDASGLLAYDIPDGRWRVHTPPVRSAEVQHLLTGVGVQVVAYLGTEERKRSDDGVDWLFDPVTGTWSALPADPLSRGFDRRMFGLSGDLLLVDKELGPDNRPVTPSAMRAAIFDPDSGRWRRLPDVAGFVSIESLVARGSLFVDMTIGETKEPRGVPSETLGGILDAAKGTWSALPATPSDVAVDGSRRWQQDLLFDREGLFLDVARSSWLRIPPVPQQEFTQDEALVTTDEYLAVFGGGIAREPRQGPAPLFNDLHVLELPG